MPLYGAVCNKFSSKVLVIVKSKVGKKQGKLINEETRNKNLVSSPESHNATQWMSIV